MRLSAVLSWHLICVYQIYARILVFVITESTVSLNHRASKCFSIPATLYVRFFSAFAGRLSLVPWVDDTAFNILRQTGHLSVVITAVAQVISDRQRGLLLVVFYLHR